MTLKIIIAIVAVVIIYIICVIIEANSDGIPDFLNNFARFTRAMITLIVLITVLQGSVFAISLLFQRYLDKDTAQKEAAKLETIQQLERLPDGYTTIINGIAVEVANWEDYLRDKQIVEVIIDEQEKTARVIL